MDDNQLIFGALFQDCVYGIRGDFAPRDWHTECTIDYTASFAAWLDAHTGNGSGEQHVFTIEGGTGSGKTHAAAYIGSFHLNHNHSRNIVVVVPNNTILMRTIEVYREQFGIHLEPFVKRNLRRGFGSMFNGYIVTYQQLMRDPGFHRRVCGPDVLVVFDEIHHLGDDNIWGPSAIEAFGRVKHFVALTGTPYRSDNTKIPYVTYEETARNGILRFKADFRYSIGQAVADGVCRRPAFFYHDATVKIRPDPDACESEEIRLTFEDNTFIDKDGVNRKVNPFTAGQRLRGAVNYMSTDRLSMLKESLAKIREAGRRVTIFLGGDSLSDLTPTEDAQNYLTEQLQSLGITPEEYVVITSDDVNARKKVKEFQESEKAWIIVSINMLSEGSDIPILSSAIFLTSITAKQTTIQRIGRVLRMMGPNDPHKEAWIFLFKDPSLYEICTEIETEVDHEVEIAKSKKRKEREEGEDQEKHYRAEAVGVGDGKLVEIAFGNEKIKPEEFDSARKWLRINNIPTSFLHTFLEVKIRRTHGHG